MDQYSLKRNDLEPPFEVVLSDGRGVVDLTTAVKVRFIMRNRAGVKVNAPMEIVTGREVGLVSYAWQLGDTDTTGTYQAEVQVEWPNARPQTFPGDGYMKVQILKDLDAAGAS